MITITMVLDESGLLKSCDIRGHAGAGKRGTNIVCAAVSVLARTALKVLNDKEGIIVRGKAEQRGTLFLETEARDSEDKDYLEAVGTYLIEGLTSVAEEFPQYCSITITGKRRN